MAVLAADVTVTRFSTSALPVSGRGKAIEELYERGLLPTRFTSCDGAVPHIAFTRRVMSGLDILTGSYAFLCHEGVPRDSDLYLCITVAGTRTARRRERELVLRDGDAVLTTGDGFGWTLTTPTVVTMAGLRLPRSAIAPLIPNLNDALMRRVPADSAALKLLRKYLGVVGDDGALSTPQSRRLITAHIYDLVALAVGQSGDAATLAESRSVGAARLRAIKADILAHLDDGDLNATAVAARNAVTVRYLHKLFEKEGISYSEFVIAERLACAYRILINPLHMCRAIGTIAFEVGFNDLSYFNRAFRRRYNATPSDVRSRLT